VIRSPAARSGTHWPCIAAAVNVKKRLMGVVNLMSGASDRLGVGRGQTVTATPDGSIMSRVITGNTMAACVVIGEKVAEYINETQAL
jgi:hypothetical protein